ncbi:MAG: polysaccharide export protein [Polyangiaceae bacterium]|nr:polysaccharide export protein [Polyangiaceae bacterium]
MGWIALVCSVAVFTASCAGAGPTAELPAVVEADDTTLGPGDVFDVRVYGEEDLSGRYRVSQDGSIDFPLVGRVPIDGNEPTDVVDALTIRLRDGGILREPQVSVMVVEYNSKRITVMGAVANTGQYPLTPGLTLVQAIGLAGGFNALANPGATMVTRRQEGELRRFRIDADAASRGRSRDFVLKAGDIVFVPERAF